MVAGLVLWVPSGRTDGGCRGGEVASSCSPCRAHSWQPWSSTHITHTPQNLDPASESTWPALTREMGKRTPQVGGYGAGKRRAEAGRQSKQPRWSGLRSLRRHQAMCAMRSFRLYRFTKTGGRKDRWERAGKRCRRGTKGLSAPSPALAALECVMFSMNHSNLWRKVL